MAGSSLADRQQLSPGATDRRPSRSGPIIAAAIVDAALGCGRPLWTEDPDFDPARHVTRRRCPAPADRRALLDLATEICLRPLPRQRPLWAAVVITGLEDGRIALLLQLHHVIADGVAGLQVLHSLFDAAAPGDPDSAPTAARPPARPRPTFRALALDSWRSRRRAVSGIPRRVSLGLSGIRVAGGLHPATAAPCSLVRRTGRDRRIEVITVPLSAVRSAAHADGVSVNEALLVAVAGALRSLLIDRSESVTTLQLAVMVAGSASGIAGNQAVPVVVPVETNSSRTVQHQHVSTALRAAIARVRSDGGTAVSAAAFGAALLRLRPVGMLYRAYLNRQRRFHALVSSLRGPVEAGAVGGHAVAGIIPISTGELGNTTTQFLALSWADQLVITVTVDGSQVDSLEDLAHRLRRLLTEVALPAPG